MKRTLLIQIFFAIISFASSNFSQTTTPTPPAGEDGDVVRISTTLIQVDATVSDKKGNIVKNLKPEDFEIYENGKKQEITNFSFVSIDKEADPIEMKKKPNANEKSSIPLPPIKLRPEQVRRTYALVVDDLGLSAASASYVKDMLKQFVNEQMEDGDLVAVLRVGAGLGALQSFTSDKRQLLAAVNKIRWNLNSRTGVGSYEPIGQVGTSTALTDSNSKNPALESNAKDFLSNVDLFRQSSVAIGTLGALNYIIRGMAGLPGRKSIMFFSEGFSQIDTGSSIPRANNVVSQFRSTIELANRSSVVIYTLDPRGVTISGLKEAQDQTSPRTEAIGVGTGAGGDPFNSRDLAISGSKDSLRSLAEETGGFAYLSNRLDLGMKKVINDQEGYYLLAYQPNESTFEVQKAKFNKLEVRLKIPELRIRYRSGFFGITDKDMKRLNQTPLQKMNAAIVSPFGSTDLAIDLYSIFYNDEKNRNFIRSLVRIDPKDLVFTDMPDGKHKANIQFVAMTFGDNGLPIDQNAKEIEFNLEDETYRKFLEKGLIYDFSLLLKKPGAYQFRIAMRDMSSNKIGSASQFINVPNIGRKEITLSNLIMKNYSASEWKKQISGQSLESQDKNAFQDTTVRQFNRGSVLSYSYVIYNALFDSNQKTHLQVQKRLFRDGKLIWGTNPANLETGLQKDRMRIGASGAISLEKTWKSGDYILQIIVIDTLAKEKRQIASQSIDFEILD